MRQCLFCDQVANTKEHLWPKWLLDKIKIGTPLSHVIGKRPRKVLPKAELQIRCVCKSCNGGWMSSLETANIPLIGALAQDIAVPLTLEGQRLLTTWAVKTAMVGDAIDTKGRDGFYTKSECTELRLHSRIPDKLSVWIGRYFRSSLGNFGTDIGTNIGVGQVTTLVVGHLTIQLLAIHAHAEYSDKTIEINPNPGPWNRLLVQIWPSNGTVTWPPPETFGSGSTSFPVSLLMDRFRIGIRK